MCEEKEREWGRERATSDDGEGGIRFVLMRGQRGGGRIVEV